MSGVPAKAPTKPLHIALAGCGKMGSAMVRAWMRSPFVGAIDVLNPSPLAVDLSENDKVTHFADSASFLSQTETWEVLVLAVKPQIMDIVCHDLAPSIPADLPILSIATGKTLEYYAHQFGTNQQITRAMPNTPSSIGKGMNVAIASANTSQATKDTHHFLLSCLGKTDWIADENLMDAVTAVSGSGPAYVFYVIEALAQAGVESGLEPDFAMSIARQTVIGAAALAEDLPHITAAHLRENVTSPNGTTFAALSVLIDGKLQSLMNEAVAKATARSKELSN